MKVIVHPGKGGDTKRAFACAHAISRDYASGEENPWQQQDGTCVVEVPVLQGMSEVLEGRIRRDAEKRNIGVTFEG